MASLNTLRTRGGVIVSIIIGIALLAFLLTDFTPRSCSEFNVGTINGNKISYEEYDQQVKYFEVVMQSMTGRESLSAQESDQAREMAWQSLVLKYSYQPGFEKLGLWASDAEQADMATGVYLSPVITGTFVNPYTGQFDPQQLAYFNSSRDSDPSGRSTITWLYLKTQMNLDRAMNKYAALVSKGMFVNDLEIENGVAAESNSVDARVLARSYSLVADSTVNVSAEDIRRYYNQHKENYKQQASRDVEYVMFDVFPSDKDFEDAGKYVDMIAGEFAQSDTPMQYAQLNSQSRPSDRYMTEAQVDPAIMAAVWGKPDSLYGPVLSNETFTMARQGEVKMLPDSVGVKVILLPIAESTLADSLMDAIRGGADFGELAAQHSYDQYASMNRGDQGVVPPEVFGMEVADEIVKHNRGDVFKVTTREAAYIIELNRKDTPVRKAQIAIITFKVEPSSATDQVAYEQASSFMTGAAGSYDNFKKATTESALSTRVARISSSDRSVRGLEDSRELVRWSFNAKKGEVSDIMKIGNDYVVAAVTGLREDGIATVEEASDQIRPILIRDRKAEKLIAELNGNTLDQVASALGAELTDAEAVTFESFYLDGIGVEQRLVGAISTTGETGKLSKPVKGETGVFLFDATAISAVEGVEARDIRVRLEATSGSYLIERLTQALYDGANVVDSRVKFF